MCRLNCSKKRQTAVPSKSHNVTHAQLNECRTLNSMHVIFTIKAIKNSQKSWRRKKKPTTIDGYSCVFIEMRTVIHR